MASTYSDRLKLELMETGANANTWGDNTNTNLQVVDAFNAGYLSKSVAGSSNITLSTNNADPTSEAANKVIEFTGALTGSITVFVPAVESNYIFFNNTSSGSLISITVADEILDIKSFKPEFKNRGIFLEVIKMLFFPFVLIIFMRLRIFSSYLLSSKLIM